MSISDGTRLDPSIFRIDASRMRKGWYSDHYFNNIVLILSELVRREYRFRGESQILRERDFDLSRIDTGNIEVEMQYFTKREPFSIVAGTDNAIAILKECTGYFDEHGEFVNTFKDLEVEAVQDGAKLLPWLPAMRIRGRYRDFAILETPTLGAIARRTRIATNVYTTVKAANGKPVLFFPARFDIHEAQAGDGYAYRIAIERYNMEEKKKVQPFISTAAQGDWWGEKGGGTTAHAFILCFLGDTGEAMMAFSEALHPDVKRIALVDTNNDNVGDSKKTAIKMFQKYITLKEEGRREEAKKYILYGVRADTASNIRDVSVEPSGNPALDFGVNPRLINKMRGALDELHADPAIKPGWKEEAKRYFRSIKIVASGGFTPEKISLFESLRVPVDIYGVGSYLMRGENNDFTADVVMVRINGKWCQMAKVGRQRLENPDLERVE
ncbi:MAG: nicotinate phosphoribosyltransferase [Acidobacteriota bacterium]